MFYMIIISSSFANRYVMFPTRVPTGNYLINRGNPNSLFVPQDLLQLGALVGETANR